MTDVTALRDAILAAPLETSHFGEEPQAGTLYVPLSHLKALRLDANVVIGGRGVGKSFWTSALASESLRALLGATSPELASIEVGVGFSGREGDISRAPNADVIGAFLDEGGDPYDLWRAVILRWVEACNGRNPPDLEWGKTVAGLKGNPEQTARIMQQPRNWRGMILFDALDRTSNVWQRMDDIVRGLLRAVLWLKSFSGLHAKVFLREDQAERTVFNVPDASKLLATKAELSWARHDLHGLLWQRLVNAPGRHGDILRSICPAHPHDEIWLLPNEMKRETETQRGAFAKLAGPWMGKDKRRGIPYTWSVNHLADGRGQTSPRSFLAAIQQAADDSRARYPQHEYALHYESLKRGIQKASEIRVTEVAEDYPWVPEVLPELRGLNVPCEYELLRSRWEHRYPQGPESIGADRLPAQQAARGWDGIREDLVRLGLFEVKKADGRIDMPDLYRVGFGLGRKGGVKPRS